MQRLLYCIILYCFVILNFFFNLLQQSHEQSKALEVKMSSDLSEFSIGDEVFGIGDMVVVFSVMSQESFSGVIAAISHRFGSSIFLVKHYYNLLPLLLPLLLLC